MVTAQPVPFSQIGENNEHVYQAHQQEAREQQDRQQQDRSTSETVTNTKNSSSSRKDETSSSLNKRVGLIAAVVIVVGGIVISAVCLSGNCSASSGASSREGQILPLISRMTLTNINLRYPPPSSGALPEEMALQWLIDEDTETQPEDERALLQRYSLATLWFHAMSPLGSSWLSPDLSECMWDDSIECVGRDVVKIEIGPNKLVGSLPLDIALLSGLESLLMYGNPDLVGPIPPTVVLLTGLKQLSFSSNSLNGKIPEQIGDLSNLEVLSLAGNQLTGTVPDSIGKLSALKQLGLRTNQLAGAIPESMLALTNLEVASFENNSFRGAMPLCRENLDVSPLVADCDTVQCNCCTQCCGLQTNEIPSSITCI